MITRQTETDRVLTDHSIRCGRCWKLLAEKASRPWRITCVRCGHTNLSQSTSVAAVPRPATGEPEKPAATSERSPSQAPRPSRTSGIGRAGKRKPKTRTKTTRAS